jgi:predicted PurR-regulated permease PerM
MDETNRDRRDQARWIILLATLAGALYLCWLMLKPFIGVLLWAGVLTVTFGPVHRWLVRATGRQNLSAVLACLLVVLTIGIPASLIIWAIIHEVTPTMTDLQKGVTDLLSPSSPITGPIIAWLDDHFDLDVVRKQLTAQIGQYGSTLATGAIGIVGSILAILVEALFVVFVMFYLFRDGQQVRIALSNVIPLRHRQTYEIFLRTREVIGASVHGVLVISMIQGALGGIAFYALGLPSAVLWSVAMMFLSLIPVTGAFIVWIPAAIYLAVSGAWIKALLLTLWGLLVIGLIDNFLRPRLVGGRAKLHELFIFFAVLGGLQVFGLIGIVLGPVVLAIALALFDAFRHPDTSAASSVALAMPSSVVTPGTP